MKFTKPFNKISSIDVSLAGGKGASLGEMVQAGIPVPPGFVLTAQAFDRFLEETDINIEIDSILHSVDHKEMHTVENASAKIQNLILSKEIPQDIKKEIEGSFNKLNADYVAVRSSATAEDSASAAWAGQLDSFLNTTDKTLLENVKKCWASLFTPRAIFYRFEQRLHKDHISVAVVVQQMINSDTSGIAFSVHPVTEDRNQLIIEASFGLGEAIVGGQVTPDSYVVEKEPRRIIDKNVYTQTRKLVRRDGGGNEWKDIPKNEAEKQVLSDKEVLELANLIIKIENHYGFPVDIEFAREDGKFYIVQSRPITTLDMQIEEKDVRVLGYNQIDWAHYLTRPIEFFLTNILVKDFKGTKLKKVFGFGHDYWLFLYNGGETMDLYRRVDELQESDRFTRELIENETRLKELFTEARNVITKTEAMISAYKKRKEIINDLSDLKKEYQKAIQQIINYFIYVIEIPYIVGGILETDDLLGKTRYEWILKECEWFRSLSHYPDFHQHVLSYLLDSLVIALNISKKDITFATSDEIFSFLDGGLTKQELLSVTRQRKKRFVGFSAFGNEEFIRDKLFLQSYYPDIDEDVKEIKGNIAQKGFVKGKAKIIISKNDFGKFKDKDILVTIQSNPSFMPVIVKCSAIIADEGGIMSHAAIISRELKKPCIIGTKIATKVLKDGMEVEVDAYKGIVRILEK